MFATKFLDPKNDFAFRQIFGTEKNKDILIHFLNDVLSFPQNGKIREVTFLKTVQDPEIASKKQSIVDVLCKDEKGVQYIVEMQVARVEGFVKRAQYYAAKAYSNQLDNGSAYHTLNQVIFLAITDFLMFPKKTGHKSEHVVLDNDTHEHDLENFSFTFLELPKFKKELGTFSTLEEKWMYFFKHAPTTEPDELEKLIGKDLVIRQAYKALSPCYWTQEELATYERVKKNQLDAQALISGATAEARAEGRAEGLVEGWAAAKQDGIRETAMHMLEQGIPMKTVLSITGLHPSDLSKK